MIGCIKKQLALLGHLRGAPGHPAQLDAIARSVARFVHNRAAADWIDQSPGYRVVFENGAENDCAWLFLEVQDVCSFFPSPIDMRRLYETRFPTRDGRSWREMSLPGVGA